MIQGVETKQDYAYRVIKHLIESRQLLPGQRIIVNRIAQEIGTSAIPVREALVRLEAERLVTTQPHIGAVVALMTRDSVLQTLETLTQLESYATRLAHAGAHRILDELRAHNREMTAAIHAKKPDSYSRANRSFHEVIYGSCGNQVLIDSIEALWRQVDSHLGSLAFNLIPGRPHSSIQEHEELIELMADTDTDLDVLESFAREHGLRTVNLFRASP